MDSEAKRTWIQTPVLPLASGIFSLGSQEPRPGTRAWRNIWIVHRAFRVGLLGDSAQMCPAASSCTWLPPHFSEKRGDTC